MDEYIGTNLAGMSIGSAPVGDPNGQSLGGGIGQAGIWPTNVQPDYIRQIALDMAIRAQGENKVMTLERAEAFYAFLCKRSD